MPRVARKQSGSGIHHVMARGIEQRDIFHDDSDRKRYLDKLSETIGEHECKLYAYCLMTNHVHLLISEGSLPLGKTMHRINTSYAFWYNTKYGRKGHLFQDRFASEPVKDDAYFLTALRYVHLNAVKAGLTSSCGQYRWDSYRAYVYGGVPQVVPMDTGFALGMFGGATQLARFHATPNDDACLELVAEEKGSDQDVRDALRCLLNGQEAEALRDMRPRERAQVLAQLRASVAGISLRQVERLTGLPKSTIARSWVNASE